MARRLDTISAMFASVARGWRGTSRARGLRSAPRPKALLELYSFENCPYCRKVRDRLTELDLDYIHRSSPRGNSPNRRRVRRLGGKEQFPFLVDPNTEKCFYESDDIIAYLDENYGPR